MMKRKNEQVHALLMHKAEQVRSAAEIILDKTKDWQLIKEFMSNRHADIVLTDQQQMKLDRYQFIYNQLAAGKFSKTQLVNQLMNPKMHNISMSQAYEDIRCSNELFSSVINFNKAFELSNEIEIAKSARAKCLEICVFKNAALFAKIVKDLIALQPDVEDNPGMNFEGHELVAVFDPRLIGAAEVDMKELLMMLNKDRKVAINIDMFEHLEFDESTNAEENSL